MKPHFNAGWLVIAMFLIGLIVSFLMRQILRYRASLSGNASLSNEPIRAR
jgi:hypothetical protein